MAAGEVDTACLFRSRAEVVGRSFPKPSDSSCRAKVQSCGSFILKLLECNMMQHTPCVCIDVCKIGHRLSM